VEDEDIFGSKSGTATSKVKPLAGVFDDDDNDIFSVKAKPTSAKQSTVTATTTKGFTDDDVSTVMAAKTKQLTGDYDVSASIQQQRRRNSQVIMM